jgi:hypothetical protein
LDGELPADPLFQYRGSGKNAGAPMCEGFEQIAVAKFASNNWLDALGLKKLVEGPT